VGALNARSHEPRQFRAPSAIAQDRWLKTKQ
jgi:hypothetical protein